MPKLVSIGNIRLNVLDRGRGRRLLLVHGFPLDHTMWRGQIAALSQYYRILAVDLRGFGKSDVTEGPVFMERFADDLAALLDALDIEQPIAFCGLSMGGYVAWRFWQRHANRLDRLILCDTRAVADTDEAARTRRETADRVLREGPACLVKTMMPRLFCETSVIQRPEMIAATQRVIMNTDVRGVSAALHGMAARPDSSELLPTIKLPTLVVCGQQDLISPVAEMRLMARAIPSARFVEVTAAGHMAPLEQPAQVNAAIREFLSDT